MQINRNVAIALAGLTILGSATACKPAPAHTTHVVVVHHHVPTAPKTKVIHVYHAPVVPKTKTTRRIVVRKSH